MDVLRFPVAREFIGRAASPARPMNIGFWRETSPLLDARIEGRPIIAGDFPVLDLEHVHAPAGRGAIRRGQRPSLAVCRTRGGRGRLPTTLANLCMWQGWCRAAPGGAVNARQGRPTACNRGLLSPLPKTTLANKNPHPCQSVRRIQPRKGRGCRGLDCGPLAIRELPQRRGASAEFKVARSRGPASS